MAVRAQMRRFPASGVSAKEFLAVASDPKRCEALVAEFAAHRRRP